MNEMFDKGLLAPILSAFTDESLLVQVNLAKTDPFVAQKMEFLQKQCYASLEKLIQEVAAQLELVDEAASKLGMKTTSVAALTSAARQRQRAGQQKRELARAIVVGVVVNQKNPDWNPLDPTTHRKDISGLSALLEMDPYMPVAV